MNWRGAMAGRPGPRTARLGHLALLCTRAVVTNDPTLGGFTQQRCVAPGSGSQSPNQGVGGTVLPPEAAGEGPSGLFQLLGAAGVLGCGHLVPSTAFVFTRGPAVCLSSLCYKDTCHWIWDPPR